MGVGVFVHDDFMREVKSPPLFWFGAELARRVVRGRCPVLSDQEVRDANSRGGLSLLVWEGCHLPEFAARPDVFRLLATSFIEAYKGYLCKEAISSHTERGQRLQFALDSGRMLWNPEQGRYTRLSGKDANDVFMEPHIVGITREVELSRHGHLDFKRQKPVAVDLQSGRVMLT